jgi:hypothetical protein
MSETSETQGAVPAAWYPDGVGNRLRYWDGTAWTEFFAEPEIAPAKPSKPMHPAAIAALLIGGLTLVTIIIVVIVYFLGVPTAAVPDVSHSTTGVSSLG